MYKCKIYQGHFYLFIKTDSVDVVTVMTLSVVGGLLVIRFQQKFSFEIIIPCVRTVKTNSVPLSTSV